MRDARFVVRPGNIPGGRLAVPGDKSVSHRALILSALAVGETGIHGLLESRDCLATADALRQLGVAIHKDEHGVHRVHGAGLDGLKKPAQPIDCGNSGTAMRLLAGVLAGQPFETVLTGDDSLSRRPMRRVATPLERMGATVATSASGTPPVRICGTRPLDAIDYCLPVASAQVKSAILLAGLYADGATRVTEPGISRDHTERMLAAFGARTECENGVVTLRRSALTSPGVIEVPGDLSSAAFFLVLAAITPDCRVELSGAGINPTRDGVLRLLQRMGARLDIRNRRMTRGGEPVADVVIESSTLQGIEIAAADVALAIDEIPVLLIAAACARGVTTVRGAAELRVKESDRLAAMAAGLRALGIGVEEFEDGIRVTGGRLRGGAIDSAGDHRIAMAFAMAGAVASGPVTVSNTENIATSYPGFVAHARQLGLDIETGQQ